MLALVGFLMILIIIYCIMQSKAAPMPIFVNKAVTIHAASFGLSPMDMGSMASIGGALGRTMSPVAGGMIICATLAGVSPMETAKRNAPGMVVAMFVTMILLFYV